MFSIIIQAKYICYQITYLSVILHLMQKHLRCKKVQPSKVESYLKLMHEQIGDNKIWYHNTAKGFSILNTLILCTGYIITSYCFQSFIGLPAISWYKFSMYFKRLAESHNYLSFGHLFISLTKSVIMRNNCDFYVLLLKYEICNRVWLKANVRYSN